MAPAVVNFPDAIAGGDCVGVGCTYGLVTITNAGTDTETLTTASASSPFWPTFGGTCNINLYLLPAGQSCTFQFGFDPPHPGKFTGTGTVNFASGASVSVTLVGFGKQH